MVVKLARMITLAMNALMVTQGSTVVTVMMDITGWGWNVQNVVLVVLICVIKIMATVSVNQISSVIHAVRAVMVCF